MDNISIFITHYTPLISRKANIIKQMLEHNISESIYKFIEIYDREDLIPSINNNTTTPTTKLLSSFVGIKLSEISLFIKHIEIFKQCSSSSKYIVVLEDDAILVNNFSQHLITYINKLEMLTESHIDWDIAFTGECCNLHINHTTKNNIFYKSNTSRGTCMYILNIGICNKLLNIFNEETSNNNTINKPIDHWFNQIQSKYNLKYLWSEPTLVSQGSETKLFTSSLR